MSDKVSENEEIVRQDNDLSDKLAIKQMIIARSADKAPMSADKDTKSADKVPITDGMADKLADIVMYLKKHPKSPSRSIATLIGLGETSSKNYLRRLISLGFIKAEGANRNRTYSVVAPDQE